MGMASGFHPKAKAWVAGRKNIFLQIKKNKNPSTLWMHCASVGEYQQGLPLLQAVKKQYPQYKTVLTFFSPSGYQAFTTNDAVDEVYYLPLDTKKNAQTFIDLINPSIAIFIKYEFWLHYLQTLFAKNIPTFLVSGIFRERSIFTKKIGFIHRKMLGYFTHFFVQNNTSKTILQQLGYANVSNSGDTRYDRVVQLSTQPFADEKIETFCANSQVLIAGSTWAKDEELLCQLYSQIKEKYKLIIVPHELNETAIQTLKNKFAGNAFLYSEKQENALQNVMIVNKMGMLSKLYRWGTVAYIGGGFGTGIHNILEPMVYGLPVMFGPKCAKFQEATDLLEINVAQIVHNASEASGALGFFIENKEIIKTKLQQHFNGNKGATKQVLDKLIELKAIK